MIVIPMAGLSSRFFKAGYTVPKYMLEAHGHTIFEHVIYSFKKYFNQETFVFIIRDTFDTKKFIEIKLKELNIKNFIVITLNAETRGQAETVALGLKAIESLDINESLTIFNIDTIRKNLEIPRFSDNSSGYLEVFKGAGNNWSFVRSGNDNSVLETTEKNPISDLCCTGLYYFSAVKLFMASFDDYAAHPEEWVNGEIYIAPMYNKLIAKGNVFHYNLIPKEDIIFCGVPEEYEEFKC